MHHLNNHLQQHCRMVQLQILIDPKGNREVVKSDTRYWPLNLSVIVIFFNRI